MENINIDSNTINSNLSSIISSVNSQIENSISSSIINSQSEINNTNKPSLNSEFTTFGFMLGMILLVLINIGPYMYYKFIKNKKIFKSTGLEPKHTI
jgi:hypothetical protein